LNSKKPLGSPRSHFCAPSLFSGWRIRLIAMRHAPVRQGRAVTEIGTFSVCRGVFDHPLFEGDAFSRREAWLWLRAR
jgi:hypothetical protein